MRRREETLNAYYCMKEVNMWKLSTVWFQLNDIVEKAEPSLFMVTVKKIRDYQQLRGRWPDRAQMIFRAMTLLYLIL